MSLMMNGCRGSKRKVAQNAIRQIKKHQQAGDHDEAHKLNSNNGELFMGEKNCTSPMLLCGGSVAIPQEIMKDILDFLPKTDIVHSASLVCTSWNQVTKHPDLWPVLDAGIWKKYPMQRNGGPPSKTVFPSMRQFFVFLRRPQFSRLKSLTPPDMYRTLKRNAFDQLAQACPSLEEMDLSGSTSIRCLALVPLDKELPRIPELFPKLKKIQVCMRCAQVEELERFAQGMGDRLVELSVRSSLDDRVDGRRNDLVDATLETLAKHCPNLERFHYSFDSDGWTEGRLTERGPMALLRNCTKLKFLHLYLPRATCPVVYRFIDENGYAKRGLKFRLMFNFLSGEFDDSDDSEGYGWTDSSDDEMD